MFYNRYITSIYIFDVLGELEDKKFEEKRFKLVQDCFCNDYIIYSTGVETEYEESQLPLSFRLRVMESDLERNNKI